MAFFLVSILIILSCNCSKLITFWCTQFSLGTEPSCSIVDASGKDRIYKVAGKFRTRRWSEKKAAAAGPGYLVRKRQKLCGASDPWHDLCRPHKLNTRTRSHEQSRNHIVLNNVYVKSLTARGAEIDLHSAREPSLILVLGICSNVHSSDRSCRPVSDL